MTYWQAFKRGLYGERYKLWALVIAITLWMLFAELVTWLLGPTALHIFLGAIAGWYWLGRVVVPWIEQKLER